MVPLEDTFSDAGRVRGFLEAELKEGQGHPGWDRGRCGRGGGVPARGPEAKRSGALQQAVSHLPRSEFPIPRDVQGNRQGHAFTEEEEKGLGGRRCPEDPRGLVGRMVTLAGGEIRQH